MYDDDDTLGMLGVLSTPHSCAGRAHVFCRRLYICPYPLWQQGLHL
jgi:hypothetical protein